MTTGKIEIAFEELQSKHPRVIDMFVPEVVPRLFHNLGTRNLLFVLLEHFGQ